jgi:hypothetical protein
MEVAMANRIVFSTSRYEFSHGHKPRGWGCWAFIVPKHGDEIIWITPACTLAECKKRLLARLALAKGSGPITAIVLP